MPPCKKTPKLLTSEVLHSWSIVLKGQKCVVGERREYVKLLLLMEISYLGTGVQCISYIIPCFKIKRPTEVYKCLRRYDSTWSQAEVLREKWPDVITHDSWKGVLTLPSPSQLPVLPQMPWQAQWTPYADKRTWEKSWSGHFCRTVFIYPSEHLVNK